MPKSPSRRRFFASNPQGIPRFFFHAVLQLRHFKVWRSLSKRAFPILLLSSLSVWGCQGDPSSPPDATHASQDALIGDAALGSAPIEAADENRGPTQLQSEKRAVVSKEPPLKLNDLLVASDVQKYFGAKTGILPAALAGQDASPTYGNLRLYSPSADEMGIAVQVWTRDSENEAKAYLQTLEKQFLGVQRDPKSRGPFQKQPGFTSERVGIKTLVFQHASRPAVVAVSCSSGICPSFNPLHELSALVQDRLAKQWAAPLQSPPSQE